MHQIIGITIFSIYVVSSLVNYFTIRRMIEEDLKTRSLDLSDVFFASILIATPFVNTIMMFIFLIQAGLFETIGDFVILLFTKIMFLGAKK